jgi:hypothetical protein
VFIEGPAGEQCTEVQRCDDEFEGRGRLEVGGLGFLGLGLDLDLDLDLGLDGGKQLSDRRAVGEVRDLQSESDNHAHV